MREILFRGKTNKGEWVEGLLWKKKYNTNKLFISCFPDKDDNEEVFVVRPETIGQYTGLTDKNGKKIFEGDIVEYKEEYGEIAYDDEQAMFNVLFDTWCTDFDHIYPYELEVIGNIHDNPELLGGD